jgi:Ca2+-binding RTX toxin-like protein
MIAPKFALGLSVGSGSEAIPSSGDELGNPQDFNDTLFGDEGDDFMFGGGGRDMLFGGGGSDYLDGGVERDEVFGEGGDDVVRGGPNDDVVHGDYKYENGSTDFDVGGDIVSGLAGDEGIDQVYGDGGTDFLFGDAGRFNAVTGMWEQRGQRLWAVRHRLPRLANVGITAAPRYRRRVVQWGDEMHGGAGRDWLGNLPADLRRQRRELSPTRSPPDPASTLSAPGGAADLGGTGQDQIQGGGGNDEIWGGGDGDWLEGEKGDDVLYGGSGIDFLVLDLRPEYFDEGAPAPVDRFDGHFGNEFRDDVDDDNATDIMLVEGTNQDDKFLFGQLADGRIHVNFQTINPETGELEVREVLAPWRANAVDTSSGVAFHYFDPDLDLASDGEGDLDPDGQPDFDPDGKPLVEQFRISGLSGEDHIEFIEASYSAFGRIIDAFDVGDLVARSEDYVGVIDGGPDDDVLIGTEANDRIDGMSGSDTIYGRSGNDLLWGDSTVGEEAASTNTLDVIFGGRGNDDLIGGPGINDLYAWSRDPLPDGDTEFGVFVDPSNPNGPLFDDSAGGTRILEDTGIDRMLGGRNADRLFGGTKVSFLFGNGGDDQLFTVTGELFETADGGLNGDQWKEFAKASGQAI